MNYSHYRPSIHGAYDTSQYSLALNNANSQLKIRKRTNPFSATSIRNYSNSSVNPYVYKPSLTLAPVVKVKSNLTTCHLKRVVVKSATMAVTPVNPKVARNALTIERTTSLGSSKSSSVPGLADLEERVKAFTSNSAKTVSSSVVKPAFPRASDSQTYQLTPRVSKYKKCNNGSVSLTSKFTTDSTKEKQVSPVTSTSAYKVFNKTKLVRKPIATKLKPHLDKNVPLILSKTKLVRKHSKSPMSKLPKLVPLGSAVRKNSFSSTTPLKLKTRYKLIKKRSAPSVGRTPVLVNSRFRLVKDRMTSRNQFQLERRSITKTHLRTYPYFHTKYAPFRFSPVKRQKNVSTLLSHKLVKLRGARFESRNNGKTLRRLSSQLSGKPKLQAQSVVNTASFVKHRSIATLINSRRKINLPCLLYNRLGKCARNQKGFCKYVHDPNRVAVCRGFLAGKCHKENCLLSHKVDSNKLPTCQFFLRGVCMKGSDCPFRHVNVCADAPVCIAFTNGYCPLGDKCPKKHESESQQGKKTFVKNNIGEAKRKVPKISNPSQFSTESKDAKPEATQRYFEPNLQSIRQRILQRMARIKGETSVEECSNQIQSNHAIDEEGNRLRPPVGDLPSFISL